MWTYEQEVAVRKAARAGFEKSNAIMARITANLCKFYATLDPSPTIEDEINSHAGYAFEMGYIRGYYARGREFDGAKAEAEVVAAEAEVVA